MAVLGLPVGCSGGGGGSSAPGATTTKTLSSITLTPAAPSLAKGASQAFTATGIFSDGSSADLTTTATWSSANAAVATISVAGIATGVSVGTTTISATQGSVSGSATLTVTIPTLVSISVSPASPSLAKGFTQAFTASGYYSDGSKQDLTTLVTWATSNTSVATIASTGIATGVSVGTTAISATQGAVSGTATLSVTGATLVSISASPASSSLAKGFSLPFTATGTFSDGSKQDLTTLVTWASSNVGTATIASAGIATGVSVGTTTISATQGSISDSTTLTVTSPTLVQVTVTPISPNLPVGLDLQFAAEGIFSDGSKQDLSARVSWTSSNSTVGSIGSTGLATGLASGTSTITATTGSISGTSALTVTPTVLSSISLDPPAPYLPLGTRQQMTATGVFSDRTVLDITAQVVWSSSAPAVANVDGTGLVSTPTGSTTLGTTTITAAIGSISGTTVVTVTQPVLTSIIVFGATPIIVGTTNIYTATAFYSDGSLADVTAQATWPSSNIAVAAVDNSPSTAGTVTAVGAGTATLTAVFGGVSGTASVTVNAATLLSIAITPASQTIAVRSQLQFTAIGSYNNGSTQDLTTQVAWSSSDVTVAQISSASGTEGLATGISAGMATLSAGFNGVTGSTTLSVSPATLTSIAVTPANSTLYKGFTQQLTATGTYSDGTTQDLTTQVSWSSSNATVASVSNLFGFKGIVSGLSPGMATITANLNGVSANATVTVSTVVLVSITVTPADKTVSKGTIVRYVATGHFSDGSTAKISNQVAWISSNPDIASINPGKKGGAGKCYTLSLGTVTITATKSPGGGGTAISGSTTLTVN